MNDRVDRFISACLAAASAAETNSDDLGEKLDDLREAITEMRAQVFRDLPKHGPWPKG